VSSVGLALARTGALARVFANPLLFAVLAGAAFSGLGASLPAPLDELVRLLATAAGPLALFVIGLSLVRPDAPLRTPMLALPVAVKLVVHPLAVWAVMSALGLDAFTVRVAVLTAALPSAGWVFIFAVRHHADAGRISATILWSTALAYATFSAIAAFSAALPAGP
jgi:malonate transporter